MDTTSAICPPSDGTYRSMWSILGSCALTLIICVWHAIHPKVPCRGEKWSKTLWKRVKSILFSFFVPEAMVARAVDEWWVARYYVRQFREKGYEWSMTHSHFAEMRGFVYSDDHGRLCTIYSLRFLELCEAGRIANPLITEKEISGMSKSDAIGKVIFVLQLFWFMLQVAVRGSNGLAVTLVELDTVCMAVLTLLLLVFWWNKPFRPECPHIFYSPQEIKLNAQTKSALRTAWKSHPSCLRMLMVHFSCIRVQRQNAGDEEIAKDKVIHSKRCKLMTVIEEANRGLFIAVSLFTTWALLGALHLIAWNFDFPTEAEKIIWRVASLVLTGAPLSFVILSKLPPSNLEDVLLGSTVVSGIASRALLVALMLASLRSLPCSAHETVAWTTYVPHL